MRIKVALLFAVAAIMLSTQAMGQSQTIRPGLWEQSLTMESQSGQMEEAMRQMEQQLAALPEDQRKMMEQMMAAQGVSIGEKESSFRVCISPEEADWDHLHLADENCDQEVLQRSRDTIRIKFTCSGDPPSSGEGEVTIVSPTEYRGNAVINTRMNGEPEQIKMRQAARWISSDCGNLSPARP